MAVAAVMLLGVASLFLVALLVALLAPFVAFLVGGRRFWAVVGTDAPEGLLDRHGLEAGDSHRVQRALARGQQAEQRLRPAVADWARRCLDGVAAAEREHARRLAASRGLTLLAAGALVVAVVVALVGGGVGGGFWLLVVVAAGLLANLVLLPFLLRRNLNRALVANS